MPEITQLDCGYIEIRLRLFAALRAAGVTAGQAEEQVIINQLTHAIMFISWSLISMSEAWLQCCNSKCYMEPQGMCRIKLDIILLSVSTMALLGRSNTEDQNPINSCQTIMIKKFTRELKLGMSQAQWGTSMLPT